jgi:hypothetical protein
VASLMLELGNSGGFLDVGNGSTTIQFANGGQACELTGTKCLQGFSCLLCPGIF